MTYDADQLPDCYEITENEIIDSIMNIQDQIDYLLTSWEKTTDYDYKSQIAHEITQMVFVQKELKNWILNQKNQYRNHKLDQEEIYINYC